MPNDNSSPLLTAADRCDRCGARAFVLAVFAGGLDLTLCGHHGRMHHDRLTAVGATVVDVSVVLPSAA